MQASCGRCICAVEIFIIRKSLFMPLSASLFDWQLFLSKNMHSDLNSLTLDFSYTDTVKPQKSLKSGIAFPERGSEQQFVLRLWTTRLSITPSSLWLPSCLLRLLHSYWMFHLLSYFFIPGIYLHWGCCSSVPHTFPKIFLYQRGV